MDTLEKRLSGRVLALFAYTHANEENGRVSPSVYLLALNAILIYRQGLF